MLLHLIAVALCVTVLTVVLFALADAMLKGREVDWTQVRLRAIERRRREGNDEQH